MTRLKPFGSNILTFVSEGNIAAVTSVGSTSTRAVSVCSIMVVEQGQDVDDVAQLKYAMSRSHTVMQRGLLRETRT